MLVAQATAYEPDTAHPYTENWRWSELEILERYDLRCVDEAPDGTLWFALNDGILSYDGHQATSYLLANSDLPLARPTAIEASVGGDIYLMTTAYLARFDGSNWELLHETQQGPALTDSFAQTSDGDIWIGDNQGLFCISHADRLLTRFEIGYEEVSAVMIDDQNRLWVANLDNGEISLYQLNSANSEPKLVATYTTKNQSKGITRFYQAKSGRIWVGNSAADDMLRVYEDGALKGALQNRPEFRTSATIPMIEDNAGDLWTFSVDGHLLKIADGKVEEFHYDNFAFPTAHQFIEPISGDRILFGGRMAKTLLVDESSTRWLTYRTLNFHTTDLQDNEWFIRYDGSVVRHEPDTETWTVFNQKDGMIDTPNAITCDRDGNIWVSGQQMRIAAVSRFDGQTWHTESFPLFAGMIGHLSVMQRQDGSMIFGSGTDEGLLGKRSGGIIVYRKNGEGWTHNVWAPPTVPSRVASIAESANGNLWTGAIGLFIKTPTAESYARIPRFEQNWIDHVVADYSGGVWVAVWGSGIHHFNGSSWRHFSEANGIASNQVVDTLISPSDNSTWAATSQGISRFDGLSWTPHALPQAIRLPREGGTLKSGKDNTLWINSAVRSWNFRRENFETASRSQFYTIRYRPDQVPPETRIQPLEEKIFEGANALIQWSGHDPWSDTQSEELEYSYRLDESPWSPFQTRKETLLQKLQGGIHRLEVRSRDIDWNIDPTPASIEFTAIPPIWKRWWFISSLTAVSILIIGLISLLIRMRIKYLMTLKEFKINFFTNISHEIRTPLAVIIGPLENLLKKDLDPSSRQLLEMAHRNARKMQQLVTHLLEFRKAESGNQKYHPVNGDLILFIKDTLYAHSPLWEERKQAFRLSVDTEQYHACFDPEKLQRIIDNLLSNAIKYTPDMGNIQIRIEVLPPSRNQPHESLQFTIEDSGMGISPENQKSIFKPYNRLVQGQRRFTGTGLGLAYTQELVNIWGGTVTVQSPIHSNQEHNPGTRFTVTLPLIPDASAPLFETSEELTKEVIESESTHIRNSSEKQQPTLLIIEDNPDVRNYLTIELQEEFSIETANNGKQGFKLAKENIPDIIVSDVMMPEMDGIELCQLLKQTQETSHIPIIMLTAKRAEEHELEGLASGADDYLGKPVNIEILKTKLQNTLETRRKLRELFVRKIEVEPSDVAVTNLDEEFIRLSLSTVEKHIQDEEFNVDDFAKEMHLSRVTFHRKLKALTGMTPVQFIRNIRLKRGAQLLRTGQFNVSEVLDKIGILDQSYFARLFKREFGVAPSSLIPRKQESPKTTSEQ